MRAAWQIEVRKFFSLRMWWVLLLVMTALLVTGAGAMALLATSPAAQAAGNLRLDSPESVAILYNMTPSFGFVFPLLIGALSLTSEYRYQTISATFLASPRRWTVVVAKATLSLVVGLGFAVVGTLACVASVAAVLTLAGTPTYLGDAEVWRPLLGGIAATSCWGLIGFGVGAIVRNQVVAVVVIIAFTQFVEPFLRLAFLMMPSAEAVGRFLPGSVSDAVAIRTLFSASSSQELLNPSVAVVVLLGYAAVLVAVGAWRTTRRTIS